MFNYLFPIETIYRELDVKLIMAVNVVDRNSRIYVGQHDYLHSLLDKLNHGVYFGKNCFRGIEADTRGILTRLKRSDLRIFYLHEEGGVFPARGDAWHKLVARQYDPTLLSDDDRIFVWGEAQREFDLSRLNGRKIPVEAVGHPRFDLYKSQYRGYFADRLSSVRSEYAPYVLINTNFGLVNTLNPWRGAIRLAGAHRFLENGSEFFRFLELLYALANEFRGTRFILRSHPSESDDTYAALFKDYENIVIRHEGPVSAWLFAADCVVHSGCTTALEAWFADVPSLDYSSIPVSPLTEETSRRCATVDEVLHALHEVLDCSDKKKLLPEPGEPARRMLHNIDGDALDVLTQRLRAANDGQGETVSISGLKARGPLNWARDQAATAKSRLFADRRARRRYDAKKFGGFDSDMVARSVAAANQLLGRQAVVEYCDPLLIVIGAG